MPESIQALIRLWKYEIQPVLHKEWIQVLNDPATFRIALFLPVFQLIVFGYGISREVRNVPTMILDQDHSAPARDFAKRLEATTYFKILEPAQSRDQVLSSLVKGQAQVGIIIPEGYAQDLKSSGAKVQVLVDGSDSTVASEAAAAIQELSRNVSLELLADKRQGSLPASILPLEIRTRFLFNPNLETSFFILPGLLGIIVFLVTSSLCSLAIVKERELGTLEQLLVTPLSALGLSIGKIIPYICIGIFDFNFSLLVGYLLFGIPVRGNIFVLELAIFVFMLTVLGISLIISTIAQNQAQALQLTPAVLLPSIFLSGYIFPFESMAPLFQGIGYLIPMTYFIRISRGIILRGAAFGDLLFPFGMLLLFGLVFMFFSVKMFKKQIG